ncbi:MAG: hypothetical protein ACREJ2_14160 [Planctomycetota bacterium]
MIKVNLLPPEKRPPEGTSPARMFVILAGLLIPLLGLFLDIKYWSTTKGLEKDTAMIHKDNQTLDAKIAAQKKITAQIATINTMSDAIESLRKDRLLWGRFHYRFYQMMTAMDKQGDNNAITRHFQLKKESNTKFQINCSVEILGSTPKEISVRMGDFIDTLNRYTGATYMNDPRVDALATDLEKIYFPLNTDSDQIQGGNVAEIEKQALQIRNDQYQKAMDDKKNAYRTKWSKELHDQGVPENKIAQQVETLILEGVELYKINEFGGLIYDPVRFNKWNPSGVDVPAPAANMQFVNMPTMAATMDFSIEFHIGHLTDPRVAAAAAHRR